MFRPAKLGSLSVSAIVLVFTVCILFCFFQKYLKNVAVKYKEEKSMKAEMIRVFTTVVINIIVVFKAVGTSLLAAALLT